MKSIEGLSKRRSRSLRRLQALMGSRLETSQLVLSGSGRYRLVMSIANMKTHQKPVKWGGLF